MKKSPYEYQQEAKQEAEKALEKAKELEKIKQLKTDNYGNENTHR